MSWNLSCPDWEQRLRDGRAPIPDLPLTSHGDRAVAVYDRLRLADVTGTPTLADASGDWFREIVRAMFGGYDPVTRARYIRELFALVPKKNSKTTYGALGLMLTALLLNERPYAPFLMTAPVQDTAELAFAAVEGAIALDPVLEKKLWVRGHKKTIVHRQTKAELEIITFDPKVVTGKKVVGALIDEVHVLGKMARADKALLQLRGGMQPFPEAFLAMITTQSDEPPTGVFKDELAKARDIRDGKRVGAMLPVLYEFPQAMQEDPAKPWRDPKNWPMVTPNLGRSIELQRLVEECRDEEAKGEGALRTWASQHLNIQIGMALLANRWAGAEFWERQGKRPKMTLQDLLARSEVVTVGIDGGGLDDLLGLTVVGREIGTEKWLTWSHAWAHPVALERRKSEESKYRDLEDAGDLTIIEELPGDVSAVAAVVREIFEVGLLASVGMDPEKTHKVMLQALVDAGIPEEIIFGISQGWKLVGAMTVAERKLAEAMLEHGAQLLMAWSVANAKVEPRGNASLITKQASGTAKIDPLMALLNGVSLMALNPAAMVLGDDYELMAV